VISWSNQWIRWARCQNGNVLSPPLFLPSESKWSVSNAARQWKWCHWTYWLADGQSVHTCAYSQERLCANLDACPTISVVWRVKRCSPVRSLWRH
jgi:hypothetical protein